MRLDRLLGEQLGHVRARDTSDWAVKEQLLLESCHPKQLGFVLDEGLRVCALVCRGAGKTTGGRARLVRRMLRTPKAKCLFIACTRQQAEDLMWAPLKDLLEKLGVEATFNETKLRCTFKKNGATLRLVGADDKREIEKLRGLPFHEVGVDESASYPVQLLEHLIFRVLGPRLGDYNGTLWLIGTPSHVLDGPFYDATRPGSEINRPWEERDKPEYAGWNRWSFHTWSLQDGAPTVPAMARLWAAALVEKERNQWSNEHPVWRREYQGQWAADDTERVYKFRPHLDDGAEWNIWDPPRDPLTNFAVLPKGEANWEWHYSIGMDMGHSDPFALTVLAYAPADPTRKIYEVYEFNRRGMYARTIAELLIGPGLNADKPGGILGVTGWPDSMVADNSGLGGSLIDELANVYGIKIAVAEKKAKFDNIELTNGDLIDGRIKLLKGGELAKQMGSLQWAIDEFGVLKEHKGQRNDQCDSFIYARREIAKFFAEESPVQQQAKPAISPFHEEDEDEQVSEYVGVLSDGDFRDGFWGNGELD